MAHLLTLPALMVHWLFWVALAAAVNALVGIVMSILTGKFDMQQTGRWLVTKVLAVVVPVVVVAVLAAAGIIPLYVFYGAAATALATLLGGISAAIGVPLKMGSAIPSQPPADPSKQAS